MGIPSISDLISNAGGTTTAFLKDTPIGTMYRGKIVSADARQKRSYETGQPLSWDNGDPQVELALIIQTDIRDPNLEKDDGRRGVYINWWGDDRQELIRALKAADDNDVRVGGDFAVKYVSDKPNENPKLNAKKIYQYWYQKPATGLDFSQLGQEQVNTQTGEVSPAQAQQNLAQGLGATPIQQPVQQQQTPAAQAALQQQQQAAAAQAQAPQDWQMGGAPAAAAAAPPVQAAPPQAAGLSPLAAQIKTFIALAMNDEQIAGALNADLATVAAVRNLPA